MASQVLMQQVANTVTRVAVHRAAQMSLLRDVV